MRHPTRLLLPLLALLTSCVAIQHASVGVLTLASPHYRSHVSAAR